MSPLIVLIVFIAALLLEGFFSGSEIAMVSCNKNIIEKQAEEGSKGAALVLKLLRKPNNLLAVTLIGTNLAAVTNTVVVTLFFLQKFGIKGELYAFLLMSPSILMFGEIIPKSIYQQNSTKIATKISFALRIFGVLFYPLVLLLGLFSRSATSFLGIKQNKANALSREDLQFLLEDYEKSGYDNEEEIPSLEMDSIKEGERDIIQNILNLRDTTVEEVMLPYSEVLSAPNHTPISKLAEMVKQNGFTRIPVYKDRIDNVVGFVHGFDILNARDKSITADKIMQPPIFVPEFQKAFRLLVDLQQARKGIAIIVNEYGGAEGIATIEDVLEEIVGEIEDEFDKPDAVIKKIDEYSYLMNGRVTINQINEELGIEIEENPEYETVAGLMLHYLKHLPSVGDSIYLKEHHFRIEVTRMSDRAILQLKIILNSHTKP
ncbi:MAG: hemolysin family protein [Myxococcota bacterium]